MDNFNKKDLMGYVKNEKVFNGKYFMFVDFEIECSYIDKMVSVNIKGVIKNEANFHIFMNEFDENLKYKGEDITVINDLFELNIESREYRHSCWNNIEMIHSNCMYEEEKKYMSQAIIKSN